MFWKRFGIYIDWDREKGSNGVEEQCAGSELYSRDKRIEREFCTLQYVEILNHNDLVMDEVERNINCTRIRCHRERGNGSLHLQGNLV